MCACVCLCYVFIYVLKVGPYTLFQILLQVEVKDNLLVLRLRCKQKDFAFLLFLTI